MFCVSVAFWWWWLYIATSTGPALMVGPFDSYEACVETIYATETQLLARPVVSEK